MTETPTITRRIFFATIAMAPVAAATNVGIHNANALSFPEAQKEKPRYRVTHDVKAFYRVNRY